MSIYRVKTVDDWQAKTGKYWDFETQDAADHYAVAVSIINDLIMYGVARIDGDSITETSMAISGILFGVSHVKDAQS